jgi:hypothetical protein
VLTQIKSGELEVRLRALMGLAEQEGFVFTLQSLIHTHTFILKMLIYYVKIRYYT